METVPAEDVKSKQSTPGLSQVKDLVNGSIPPLKTKGIKFGHLNIHSLVKKIDSLRILLKNKPFDVISFNETLCDFTVSDSEIAIDGFNIFRRDRNRHGGGVAVYVTETFNAKRRQDLESDDLENVWVEMCYPHKSPILVGSFYRPPSAVYDFNSEFEKNIDCVSHVGMDCIILGDFNYDQTPPVRDTHCCNFLFHTTCNGFTQLIATPTRVTNHSNTLIDLIFVTNPNMYRDYGVFLTCISDHFLIYAVRDFNENTNLTGECIEYRSFKHLDEQKFKDDLGNVPWEAINDIDDVDVALDTWISLFMAVVDDHVPLRKKRLRKNPCPWITDEIVDVMKQRDRKDVVFRLWHRILPTRDKLIRMKVTDKSECPLCHFELETIDHLFIYCTKTTEPWLYVESLIRRQGGCRLFCLTDCTRILGVHLSNLSMILVGMMIRNIWKTRCDLVFDEEKIVGTLTYVLSKSTRTISDVF